jgi:hypothetical protein
LSEINVTKDETTLSSSNLSKTKTTTKVHCKCQAETFSEKNSAQIAANNWLLSLRRFFAIRLGMPFCQIGRYWFSFRKLLLAIARQAVEMNIVLVEKCIMPTRVARWHIFKPKISIWVNFGESCNERCWYILWPFGILYGYLVYCMVIGYNIWLYGICTYFMVIWYIFHVLVRCTKKNLATLMPICFGKHNC